MTCAAVMEVSVTPRRISKRIFFCRCILSLIVKHVMSCEFDQFKVDAHLCELRDTQSRSFLYVFFGEGQSPWHVCLNRGGQKGVVSSPSLL